MTQRPRGATWRGSTSCNATRVPVRNRESQKERQDGKAKLEPPPADVIEQKRGEVLDAVRRAIA